MVSAKLALFQFEPIEASSVDGLSASWPPKHGRIALTPDLGLLPNFNHAGLFLGWVRVYLCGNWPICGIFGDT